ncbi:MAG: hypothetical protein U0694_22110 [Anaerolineae bacterium]
MTSRGWFVGEWVFFTVIGWWCGLILAVICEKLFYGIFEQPFYSSIPVLYVVILTISFLQLGIVLEDILSLREAICVSVASATLCTIAQYILNLLLPAAFYLDIVFDSTETNTRLLDGWFLIILLSSIMLGTSFSFPQWLRLRKYRQGVSWLFINNSIGVFAVFLAFVFSINFFEGGIQILALLFSSCLLSPLMFAVITGFPLYNLIARKPKLKHNDEAFINAD